MIAIVQETDNNKNAIKQLTKQQGFVITLVSCSAERFRGKRRKRKKQGAEKSS